MNIIFTLALLATSIASLSLIDPPGWIIVLTPALISFFIPSGKGKKASEAAIEFLSFPGWNLFAFWAAILQLSNLLGCPAPIPIVEKLFEITIEFDLTNLQILKANSAYFNSFFVGLSLVTNLSFFTSIIFWFLSWTKNELSKYFIFWLLLFLNFEIY